MDTKLLIKSETMGTPSMTMAVPQLGRLSQATIALRMKNINLNTDLLVVSIAEMEKYSNMKNEIPEEFQIVFGDKGDSPVEFKQVTNVWKEVRPLLQSELNEGTGLDSMSLKSEMTETTEMEMAVPQTARLSKIGAAFMELEIQETNVKNFEGTPKL